MTGLGELRSAMPVDATVGNVSDYRHSVWVGSVDIHNLSPDRDLRLEGGSRFGLARLLIWEDASVRGFVELAVVEGCVAARDLERAIAELPMTPRYLTNGTPMPISVIVCTRDRPDDLARSLAYLASIEYQNFEIVVVDSSSRTRATRDVVESLNLNKIRYLRLDLPGLARARNAGAEVAEYDCLAFTDDDTIVDKRWLAALNDGFAAASDVGCVTGLVASGQLVSESQHYFDRRVTWARNIKQTIFRLDEPPEGVPLFPFQFGAYGTGANFAIKRSLLRTLGGFDNALGVGSPTGSGEDTDLFIRVVLSQHAIVYQPNAVVWHKHRIDADALATQLENYGVGLGAVLAKLVCNPKARRLMGPLAIGGTLHALKMVRVSDRAGEMPGGSKHSLKELRGIMRGPWALRRARRADAARGKMS